MFYVKKPLYSSGSDFLCDVFDDKVHSSKVFLSILYINIVLMDF